MFMSFPPLPGIRNQSNLSTHTVRLIVGDIDGAMVVKGQVETNGDMLGLFKDVGEAL